MAELRIWAILGQRRGDNNQVLALAEALGLPFETKQLEYNSWRHVGPVLLGASTRSLSIRSREAVSQDPPDLTISTGHRSVPIVQWLRRRSNGRMRSVHIGYPRISPQGFDLVVATPEYPIADHPNLRRIPFALTRTRAPAGEDRLAHYPSPRRLLILGGPTLYWSLRKRTVSAALAELLERAQEQGGAVLVVSSPRTPSGLTEHLKGQVRAARVPAIFGDEPNIAYGDFLDAADEIFVTADSVAMISEALVTGKPVGAISIDRSALGRIWLGLMDWLRPGRRVHPRDLRFFWQGLEDRRLIGTLDRPRAAGVADLTTEVASWVRSILSRVRTEDR